MKTRTRIALAGAVLTGSTLVLAPSAVAEERTCRGAIGAVTLDNIRVPAGATCRLTGTYLKGTLKVEGDAHRAREPRPSYRQRAGRGAPARGDARLARRRQHPGQAGRRARPASNYVTGDIQYDTNTTGE